MKRTVRSSPEELALIAKARAERALSAYEALGDHWHFDTPGLATVADIAVDTAIGLEASLKCIAGRHIRDKSDRPRDIFRSLLHQGQLPEAVIVMADAYTTSLNTLFRARNAYLHGGLPSVDVALLLRAVRDALHLLLDLAASSQQLGAQWTNLSETAWEFGGQRQHFASQVRSAFSGRRLVDLPLFVHAVRFTGGSALSLGGVLNAVVEVEQSHWDWSGATGSISRFMPSVRAEIGMIAPPDGDSLRRAPGERIVEGTVHLLLRDVPVRADSLPVEGNPLAAPIYLFPNESRQWMVGPGDLMISRLNVQVPYRAKAIWFVTPDGRLEMVSELMSTEGTGEVAGELRFHYPGHSGHPAFRGVATIEGRANGCFPGFQAADWKHVKWDPQSGEVKTWWWDGVSKLDVRWSMLTTFSFGEVEVFQ